MPPKDSPAARFFARWVRHKRLVRLGLIDEKPAKPRRGRPPKLLWPYRRSLLAHLDMEDFLRAEREREQTARRVKELRRRRRAEGLCDCGAPVEYPFQLCKACLKREAGRYRRREGRVPGGRATEHVTDADYKPERRAAIAKRWIAELTQPVRHGAGLYDQTWLVSTHGAEHAVIDHNPKVKLDEEGLNGPRAKWRRRQLKTRPLPFRNPFNVKPEPPSGSFEDAECWMRQHPTAWTKFDKRDKVLDAAGEYANFLAKQQRQGAAGWGAWEDFDFTAPGSELPASDI